LLLFAERASDITFLRHVVSLSDETLNGIGIDAALSLSGRLTQLGFAERGFDLANRPTDTTRRHDRSQLRAEAALQMNNPRQALLELSGKETDEARRLRARALMDSQDYIGAALVLDSLGTPDEAGRNFWLAGSLEEAEVASGKYGHLAQISRTLAVPLNRQHEKPLSDAAALLEQSTAARAQINDFLRLVVTGLPNQLGSPEDNGT
jgi:hypothetical protein